ncbi:unknown [Bacteroides caccae CAG:21]|nr:unknown [Bacteroides caccae CAG:21]
MFLFTKPEADMSHKNGFVLRTFEDTVAIGIATFFNRINAFPPLNVHRFHGCYQVLYFHAVGSDILHSACTYLAGNE